MLMSLLFFVLFGFIVGLVARLLAGGPAGFWETSGVGMAGALLGGLLSRGAGWSSASWSLPGFLVSLLGAVLLIVAARAVRRAA